MLEIVAVYKGRQEVVDTADTEREAVYLTQEYQLAYGSDWTVFYRRRFASKAEERRFNANKKEQNRDRHVDP